MLPDRPRLYSLGIRDFVGIQMALIVQKYGGTSVGTVERIQAVVRRVIRTVKAGNSVVMVVSAMGKSTDGLVKLANEISESPSRREMDM